MEFIVRKISNIKNYNNLLLVMRHKMRRGNKLINIAISDTCYNGVYKEEVNDLRNSTMQLERVASLKHSLSRKESNIVPRHQPSSSSVSLLAHSLSNV